MGTTETLSAVVFAESFSAELRPLSFDTPRVLFPLCNAVVLDYTIEFLLQNNIKKILLFCSSHADRIRKHIGEGRWGRSTEVNVDVYASTRCASLAEALREIYLDPVISRKLTGDFLLLYGDMVCNYMDLQGMWQQHKARRAVDPQVLMTLMLHADTDAVKGAYYSLLQSAVTEQSVRRRHAETPLTGTGGGYGMSWSPSMSTTFQSSSFLGEGALYGEDSGEGVHPYSKVPLEQRVSVTVDPKNNVVLNYCTHGDKEPDHRRGPQVEIEASILATYSSVLVRSDLLETGITLCSHEILQVFKEGFDFKTMNDCIDSTLADDIVGNKLAIHVMPASYFCCRVRSPHHYLHIATCVNNGWTSPMRPDIDFSQSGHKFTLHHPHLYIHSNAAVHDRNKCVHASTLVGDRCVISSGAHVSGSTLADGVTLGIGARVENSVVWANTTIGHRCSIKYACIGSNVVIGDDCIIAPGTILSSNVILAPRTATEPFARITAFRSPGCALDESEEAVVGRGGRGASYIPNAADGNKGLPVMHTAPSLSDLLETVIGLDGYVVVEEQVAPTSLNMLDNSEKFRMEVVDAVRAAIEGGHDNTDTAVGLSQLRFTFNKTPSEVGQCMICALVKHSAHKQPTDAKEAQKVFKEVTKLMKPLVMEDRFGGSDDLLGYLKLVAAIEALGDCPHLIPRAGYFLKILHDLEIVEEDGIFKMDNAVCTKLAGPKLAAVWGQKSVSEFVGALRDAEEED